MAGEAAREPRFDPRFDPRFQRGYEPPTDAARPATAPEPEAAVEATAGVVDEGSPDTAAGRPGEAAREESPTVSTEPAHVPPGDAASTGELPVVVVAAVSPTGFAAGSDGARATRDAPSDPPTGRSDDPARVWTGVGWAIAVGAIVAGCSLFWTSVTGQAYFTGASSFDDRLLQSAAWMLGPPLVEAGVISVIALLVAGAIRRARPRRRGGSG